MIPNTQKMVANEQLVLYVYSFFDNWFENNETFDKKSAYVPLIVFFKERIENANRRHIIIISNRKNGNC